MRKALLSLLLIFPGLVSWAQQVTINYASDSTYYNCSMPLSTNFMVSGNANGYGSNDSISITIETGDGAVYTQTQPASSQYYGWFNHTYTAHGNYTVKYYVSIPGASDSIIKPFEVMAGVCDTLTGTAFYDQNGNCIMDAGETPLSGFYVGLNNPGENYPSFGDFTDANGDYSIAAPAGSNLFTINYQSNSGCLAQGSTVTIPGTLDIPVSSPVLFINANSNPSNSCLNNPIYFGGQVYHTGLSATDTIFITMHFGDGTSTNKTLTTNQTPYFSTTHSYSSPGTYQAWYTLSAVGYSDTITLSSSTIVGICGNVSGTVYEDLDQDCVQDANEIGLANRYIMAFDPNGNIAGTAATNTNGNYSIDLPVGTTYTITQNTTYPIGYLATCPATNSHTVSTFPSTNDFGVECGIAFDLMSYGQTSGIVPGMPANFTFSGTNQSCAQSSGILQVIFDQTHLTIDSFSIAPTSISGNVITWNFSGGNISPTVYAHADTIVQLGDTLCFPISVTPLTGDLNPNNNAFTLCRVVSSSYDPNMKEGWHGVGSEGYIKQETTLDYTIHFQNTGTAPAMNVYIRDTLPPELDPSTLEIIGASHPFNWYSWQGNQLKFEFSNINLPDSNSNEPASKGFVMYRIKTVPNLPHGSKIENGAAIYFDYNEPVITNKTLHTIDIFLNVNENGPESKLAELYPNPSSGYVYVDFKGTEGNITIHSITGSEVQSMSLRNGVNTLELDKLSPGIYFFMIRSGEEVMSGKMIKQ